MSDTAPDTAGDQTARLRKAARTIQTLESRLAEKEAAQTAPVAVTGIGCRLPGGIADAAALWTLLAGGGDVVTEIPRHRWDIDRFHDPSPLAPGKIVIREGALLDDIEHFDAAHFGITPREAAGMDPQQRIMLEVAHETFEDAGLTGARLAGSRTGVFVGVTESEYAWRDYTHLPAVDAYTGTGAYGGIVANRLSYTFDLRGPSFTVDSICSSSLLAVHQACQAIRGGECDGALAGGACVLLGPDQMIWLSKLGVLSPDARCKAFDAEGNGIVLGEGVASVMLRPLDRAVADGDRIYAVIRGNAAGQDGRSNGMTAPSRPGQEALLRTAYERFNLDPHGVGYVDAHGTGTRLGDPIEAGALGNVLGAGRSQDAALAIGSVKTNLAHLGPVGGIASLLKVALGLHHGTLPPSLHFSTPNPEIPFDSLALRVPTTAEPWPSRDGRPLMGGVSSLAFGGTNVHVVLDAAPAPETDAEPEPAAHGALPDDRLLLPLSARSGPGLADLAGRWATFLAGLDPAEARPAAACAALRRDHDTERAVIAAADRAEAVSALTALANGGSAPGLHRATAATPPAGPVLVCSGQGSQHVDMARRLMATVPAFRETIEGFDAAARRHVSWSLVEELERAETGPLLTRTDMIQPALCAIQIALGRLWQALGIRPGAVVGTSMGEVAAAAIAGALDLDQAARVICLRTRLIADTLMGHGAMAVVELDLAGAREAIAPYDGRLSVAVSQSPRSCVLSGDPDAMNDCLAALDARGVFTRHVRVDFASHSHHVEAIRPALIDALADLTPGAADVPLWSTVRGERIDGHALDGAYWADNLRQPVLFAETVAALANAEHDRFIEISPHPLLLPAIEENVAAATGGRPLTLPSMIREHDAWETLAGTLATLHAHGTEPDWTALFGPAPRHRTLPLGGWNRKRHWLDVSAGSRAEVTGDPDDPVVGRAPGEGAHAPGPAALLGPGTRTPAADAAGGERRVLPLHADPAVLPWLADHRPFGRAVVPAAGVVDALLALAAGDDTGVPELHDLALDVTLPAPGEACVILDTPGQATVWLRREDAAWVAAARVDLAAGAGSAPDPASLTALAGHLAQGPAPAAFYDAAAAQGAEYGERFRLIDGVWAGPGETLARIAPGEAIARLDAALQACFVEAGEVVARMPVGIDAVRRFAPLPAGAPVYAHVRHTGGEDPVARHDLTIVDESGRVRMLFEGVQMRRAGATADAIDTLFLRLAWTRLDDDAPAAAETPHPAPVAVAEPGGRGARLAGALDLPTADSPGDGGRDRVSLTALDAPDTAPAAGAAADTALDAVLRPLLDQVQAALAAGVTRLVVVTAGAQKVAPADTPDPVQAAVWGMMRSVALEHPALGVTLVDLDDPADAATGRALGRLLAAAGPPRQAAIRDSRLHAARLVRGEAALAPDTAAPETPEPAATRHFALHMAAPGSLADLHWREAPAPEPGPGEVAVTVAAAGLNFMDVARALGLVSFGEAEGAGLGFGMDACGTVAALGPGVTDPAPGQRVLAVTPTPRAMARQVVTPAALTVALPDPGDSAAWAADPATAAAQAVAYMTAHHGLVDLAGLRPGESVLIPSAAGGVGLAAVHIARAIGAEIHATAGTPEKRAMLMDMGVASVHDTRDPGFAEGVRRRTGGRGVDVVLNALTGEAARRGLDLLVPFGRFVEMGKRDQQSGATLPAAALGGNIAYFSLDLAGLMGQRPEAAGRLLETVAGRLTDGTYAPLPVDARPAAEAAATFQAMARGQHTGRLALTFDDPAALPVLPPARPGGAADAPAFGGHEVVAITGGTGGLGRAFAAWAAARGARRLALIARRAPGPETEAVIDDLRAAGVDARPYRADVADPDATRDVAARIQAEQGPVAMVLHGAAALDDGLVPDLDWRRFHHPLPPKVQGALALAEAVPRETLRALVLFSSTAALLGAPGQANYAAANAFLDGLAARLADRGVPAVAVNWGPWRGTGGVADRDLAQRFAASGLVPLDAAEGTAALDRVLATGQAVCGVARLDPARWLDRYGTALGDLMADLAGPPRAAGGGAEAGGDAGDLAGRLADLAPDRRTALLVDHLAGRAAQCIGIERAGVAPENQTLADLGLDSLMALNLRNYLEADLGLRLPATLAWNHPAFPDLAAHLLERLGLDGADATLDTAAAAPAQPEGTLSEADLNAMSEAEAEAELMKRLTDLGET